MSTTANRLAWPKPLRRLLKMDDHGGLPRWWQWFVPRYGRWGGPGWSGGRWNVAGQKTKPADGLDALFMRHDGRYQAGEPRVLADEALAADLRDLAPPPGLYGRLYRRVAIGVFSLRAGII